jgi:GDP-4-dehydro-6-deoxy-D-mannose reductase
MTPGCILVTGAGGFVGRHLLPALAAAFPQARIVGTGLSGGGFAPLDVADAVSVRDFVAATQPDVCIHLAGIAAIGTARADPDLTWRVNFLGPMNIGRTILAAAPSCRLLFVSSAEVYGASFKPGAALDETAPLAPMNIYAASKAAAEMGLCALAADGLRVIRLRPFNHTGPGQSEDFVVPAFAGQIARIEAGLMPPEMAVGALDSERDFLDVRDVCDAYVACVGHFDKIPNNAIFNVSTGQAVPIARLLEQLLAQTDRAIAVRQDPARLRRSDIKRAAGDSGRALEVLGWRARRPLHETLASVLTAARRATTVIK